MSEDSKITIYAIIAFAVFGAFTVWTMAYDSGKITDCKIVALQQKYTPEQAKEVCRK